MFFPPMCFRASTYLWSARAALFEEAGREIRDFTKQVYIWWSVGEGDGEEEITS